MPLTAVRSPKAKALAVAIAVGAFTIGSVGSASADSLTTTINLGDYVVGAAVSPDGSKLFVTRSANWVDVVSTSTNSRTKIIAAGDNPRDVEFNSLGSLAYVPNYGDNTLSVINPDTETVSSTISLGTGNPTDVALSPTRSVGYVTMVSTNVVKVVDLSSGSVVGSISVGTGPNSVAFSPDGTRAFVANSNSDSVSVINALTDTVISTTNVGDEPFAISVAPDGQRVYVTNYGSKTISVLDGSSGSISGSIALSGQPLGVQFTPNGTRALVPTRFPNAVEFIDVASGTSTGSIALGAGPLDVAITPNAGTAYVTNFNTFSVSVIDMTATPSAPTAVAGLPGNGSVDLTWTAPTDPGDAPITGYRVQRRTGDGSWTTEISDTGSTGTSATVTGLTNGTTYRFRVLAINSAGAGVPSLASSEITPTTTPGQPGLAIGTPGDSEVALTWSAPADTGGSPVTGYRVDVEAAGGPWATAIANTSSASTAATVTGLTNGTSYRFRVAAINAAGAGPTSDPTSSATPRTVPGVPTGLTGTAGNGQVSLSWTAPVSNGGDPLTGYRIESKVGNDSWTVQLASTNSSDTAATVTGLTNGTTYTFRVSAINGAGTGSPSDASSSLTPVTTPGAPTGVAGTPGDRQVSLTWTTPVSDGGAAIIGYVVEVRPAGGSWSTTIQNTNSSATSADVTGLTNGTQYQFRVSAITSAGTGTASAPSSGVTPRTTPGQTLDVSAEPGDEEVLLTWTAPSSDGGAPIAGYRVEKKTASGSWSTAITNTGTTATSATITGLTNGTDYQFRVSALNDAGAGTVSDPCSSVTPRTVPGVPTNVQGTAGNGQVELSWTAPASDGGSPISSFRIESKAGDGEWSVAQASTGSASTGWVVAGLTNGVQYRFRVAATNAAGTGAFSPQSTAITPVTVPGVPTALSAIAQDEQVSLSWTAPSATGGSPITGYRIDIKQGDAAWTTAIADTGSVATEATITALTNGTEYRFRVAAVNFVGSGLTSDAAGPVIPRTTAGTPTDLDGTAGDRYVDLAWTPPATTGGSTITGYRIEIKSGADEWAVSETDTGSSEASWRIGSLTNGVSYRFRVAAINAAGTGPTSAPSSVLIPRTVPGAPTGLLAEPGDESIALSWDEPANTGGKPIIGYRVEMRVADGTWDVLAADTGTHATAIVASGLANGVPHRFRVTARNEAGFGPTSLASSATTPLTTPGSPTAPTGVVGDGRIDLTWNAPGSDGGSPILGYRIEFKPSGGSWATRVADTGSTATAAKITELTNGLAYTFRVSAINAAGTGTVSAPSLELTPFRPTAPNDDGDAPPKTDTVVKGWPSRILAKGGKARLTLEITPAQGRIATVQEKVCTRKPAKKKCRWAQSSSRQLAPSNSAVVKVTLRARKQTTEYRLVLSATANAERVITRTAKVLSTK